MAAKFSPSDAAVSVFSFAKQNPQFTMKYMLYVAVFSLLIGIVMSFSGIYEFNNHVQGINPSSGDMGPLLDGFKLLNWPIIILSLAINIFIGTIISAFGLRKTILNQEPVGLGLGFGKDEQNLLQASLILGVIGFLGMFAISFVGALLAEALPALAILVPVLMVLGAVFLFGRYGQFGIYAILNKTTGIKESFAATKNQFWSYVGAYFLCFIIFIIIILFVVMLLNPLFKAVFGDNYFPNPINRSEALAFGTLLHQFISAFVGGFVNLAFICVGAFAYHQMNDDQEITEETKEEV